MKPRCLTLMAMLTVLLGDAYAAAAQVPPAPPGPPAPPPLKLPAGVRVRVCTYSLAGERIDGTLVGTDATSITLVPKGSHPLVPSEMKLPAGDVTRLDVALGRKSHWWQGAVVGALLGAALAFTDDVDPALCKVNENVLCSRGDAILTYGLGSVAVGTVVGALIKTDRWTPVALDALGPPPAKPVRESRALSFRLSFRF